MSFFVKAFYCQFSLPGLVLAPEWIVPVRSRVKARENVDSDLLQVVLANTMAYRPATLPGGVRD